MQVSLHNNSIYRIEQTYKQKLLNLFCVIMLGLNILSFIYIPIAWIFINRFSVVVLFNSVLSFGLFLGAYYWGKQGNIQGGSWLLIGIISSATAVSYAQFGTESALIVTFFLPIGLAIALLSIIETIIISFVCIIYCASLFVVQNVLKIYVPATSQEFNLTAVGFFVVLVVMPIIIVLLLLPAREQNRLLKQQNLDLLNALEEIRNQQDSNVQISRRVNELVGELKTNATQQASGSQQQVSTIVEVSQSVAELSVTAENISNLAAQVSTATFSMEENSREIENTTLQAVEQSERGLDSVQKTSSVSQEVANIYQSQLELFQQLNTKNANMRRILDLLQNISNETHLLALNAAIEAAGAGEFGERFKVVAQEVKNLATRSASASREVVDIIKEVASATASARTAVETGFQKAQEMSLISEESGLVIDELRLIADRAKDQSKIINQITHEVINWIDVIKIATNQQKSASLQVLEALSSLTTVAKQNAQGSDLVSTAAVDLEQVSKNLNLVLAA